MEFNKFKLKELLQVNPRMTLKKGSKAKKIAMENIKEFQKKIDNFTIEEFKSGSKFQNGDTLLARITPCLENGKTAYVDILEDDEIAFGSTEFFVLRPIDNKLDSQFLYYLFRTKKVREIIIKSMTGTSGRQRAQKDSILEYECEVPTIEYQRKIAIILKNLDDKIEINKKIIANLEELSQTIFKHWFIDFEFPNQRNSPYNYNRKETSKDLPHGWKWEKLNHLFKINYGKNLPTKNLLDTGYPVYGGNGKIGYYSNYMYDDPKILISCRGAASGAIHVSQEHSFITNNSIVLDEIEKEYFYYFKELFSRETFKRYTTGSAQPQITIVNIKELKFLVPPKNLVIEFNKHQKPIFDFNSKLKQENSKLKSLRDTLLPKLMSGEIEIPDDIEVNMDELSI